MCEVIEHYIGLGEKRGYELGRKDGEERGEKRGYKLGKKEGEKQGLLIGIRILLAEGYTVADISKKMQVEKKFVEDLLREDE